LLERTPPARAYSPSVTKLTEYAARRVARPADRRRLDPQRLPDHLDRLYRAAIALCGSRAEAEDLVQETYLQVLKRPRFLRGEDDLGYLLRALRNTFYNQLRAAGRRPRTAPLPEGSEELEDRAATSPVAAAESREVLDLVAALPEPFREAVVAVDVVGLSYREAARALGTREGTIMSRLYRGRRELARALGGDV
jgi:RNA polymerase sigma-70 factor (ECF subfamily)